MFADSKELFTSETLKKSANKGLRKDSGADVESSLGQKQNMAQETLLRAAKKERRLEKKANNQVRRLTKVVDEAAQPLIEEVMKNRRRATGGRPGRRDGGGSRRSSGAKRPRRCLACSIYARCLQCRSSTAGSETMGDEMQVDFEDAGKKEAEEKRGQYA